MGFSSRTEGMIPSQVYILPFPMEEQELTQISINWHKEHLHSLGKGKWNSFLHILDD